MEPATDLNKQPAPAELLAALAELQQEHGKYSAYAESAKYAKRQMAEFYADEKEPLAKLRRDDFRQFERLAEAAKARANELRQLIGELRKAFPGDTPRRLHTWLVTNEEGIHGLMRD